VLKSICTQFSVEMLKREQQEMIKSLLEKTDCMAVLPTGYGKSLPYQMFIPLVRELKKMQKWTDRRVVQASGEHRYDSKDDCLLSSSCIDARPSESPKIYPRPTGCIQRYIVLNSKCLHMPPNFHSLPHPTIWSLTPSFLCLLPSLLSNGNKVARHIYLHEA